MCNPVLAILIVCFSITLFPVNPVTQILWKQTNKYNDSFIYITLHAVKHFKMALQAIWSCNEVKN